MANLHRGLTPRRLRLFLGLLFLALLIPSSLLTWQTQEKLKWEAFHQYREQADELAQRIDRTLQEAVLNEEKRTYADYQFFVVSGDPGTSNYIQRSPLASFPVDSEIPGLIGYFQVNAQGRFSSPVLPPAPSPDIGVSTNELAQRQSLQQSILDVLSQNELVSPPRQAVPVRVTLPPRARPGLEYRLSTSETREESMDDTISSVAESSVPGSEGVPDEVLAEAEQDTVQGSVIAGAGRQPYAPAPGISRQEKTDIPKVADTLKIEAEPRKPVQAAFDKLSKALPEEAQNRGQNLGNLKDLKLKKLESKKEYATLGNSYAEKSRALAPEIEKPTAPLDLELVQNDRRSEAKLMDESVSGFTRQQLAPARSTRREQTALVEETPQTQAIKIFESEIDPFEIAQLDSGHFVLFRKVWRDGQRTIQGALIDPQQFLQGIFSRTFKDTSLARMSDLIVAYQGNILKVIPGSTDRGYLGRANELEGTLLHQVRLSAPLQRFQLLWSINQLPAGPGASIILWTSLILFLVLISGFIALYALGLRQIRLARQQQDFVSAVSHELKTPLTSIRMYGEMLREGWVSDAKKREYYDFIHDESERLSRLIANVLQLARMERNDIKLDCKTLAVTTLADIIRSKVSSHIERAGFSFEQTLDANCEDLQIHIDSDAFTQILINLIDNAIKFSRNADIKKIDIQIKCEQNRQVVFSVRDYGPGIAKSQLKKIFQLFYRQGNELTRETVGTGIGLALVKQLTEAMGGKVDVVNEETGLRFELVFGVY
ncbi:MAG: HAMP domain-containing histidine kinase [Pseudomonadales bacterium]|nr:HAMP domain-containing histidine kinase [Pseudomonadales bacterium]